MGANGQRGRLRKEYFIRRCFTLNRYGYRQGRSGRAPPLCAMAMKVDPFIPLNQPRNVGVFRYGGQHLPATFEQGTKRGCRTESGQKSKSGAHVKNLPSISSAQNRLK